MPIASEKISTLHDARLGFADIAPLPHFKYSFWTTESVSILILSLATVILTWLYLWHKFKSRPVVLPELSVNQVVHQKINDLLNLVQTDSISLKDLAVNLSEIMRFFLTKQINFQTVGLTVREIYFMLADSLAKNLLNSEKVELEILEAKIKNFFNLTENYIFAKSSQQTAELQIALINQAKEIIEIINGEIIKQPDTSEKQNKNI
ncbi:MAG: hypothetical protein LBE20_01125 [Deltaproteobacteria bacterium]|jgi:hypothetical protein|nr:hypothetical protein [Deltaproteobacteria bacterium]